jgi:hypothetical protein
MTTASHLQLVVGEVKDAMHRRVPANTGSRVAQPSKISNSVIAGFKMFCA